ncbi:jg2336 [Pararge aegeria aegeria]|uniref:Jg2336 protein n=1 Tax=Pararge aegeria aegeria TaxID=348720 RepID=A0A8S4R5M9_9NEOP|nr:jg2336 [Pararge aegeria aegeria]
MGTLRHAGFLTMFSFTVRAPYNSDKLEKKKKKHFIARITYRKCTNKCINSAHLLLFFLAFVFGSFCTFCFHMLMYLFDEKCVLFPKLLSLSSLRQNILYEFIPEDKDVTDMLPVDFLTTQWVEQSTCLLPTYVPLVSAIFGLVWTTMFLMCSIGSRVLTGCSYTVNVATLAYQRRIRGLYQATRLTIVSAWLHTACWLLSAVLALARVLLAVDFKLVRTTVELQGNIDRMLERNEKQISTVSPSWTECRLSIPQRSHSSIRFHFIKKMFQPNLVDRNEYGDLLYCTDLNQEMSELALVTTERIKLDKLDAVRAVSEEHQFIVIILYNLLDNVGALQYLDSSGNNSSETGLDTPPEIIRQYGQQQITSALSLLHTNELDKITSTNILQTNEAASFKRQLQISREASELKIIHDATPKKIAFKSSILTVTSDRRVDVDKNMITDIKPDLTKGSEPSTSKGKEKTLKSNLKHTGVQTDERVKGKSHKVQIESRTEMPDSQTSQDKDGQVSKKTQTYKEKQD